MYRKETGFGVFAIIYKKILDDLLCFTTIAYKLGAIHDQSRIIIMKQQLKSSLVTLFQANDQILFRNPSDVLHTNKSNNNWIV
jgi:hypothetical protein